MLKKILPGLLTLVIFLVIAGLLYYRLVLYQAPLISNTDRAQISVMPLPASMELKKGTLDLSKGIRIESNASENAMIEKSITRFSNRLTDLFQIGTNENGVPVKINCLNPQQFSIPEPDMDESYSLQVDKQIVLTASTQWGVNHGLETILQLISDNNSMASIPKLKLGDRPKYKWRGLMLDVSRHWIPKDVVLRILDGMAAVKMNVFHWHLSDDQGFRVESKVFPGLHEQGSDGKYYSQDEIREVIAFAAERGIRIVPEFDIPGHSKSWQIAYPELGSSDNPLILKNVGADVFSPPLDPTNEKVYEFLDQLIGEMGALFPDQYFHIGGDEVNSKYWDNNTRIQQFMRENNLADAHALQAYFNKRVQPILVKHGKKLVGWQEILHPDLGNDILIQAWVDQKTLFEGIQRGTSGILSAGWYLDHKLHAGKYYQVDPLILPGAVDIEPDSTHWKIFDLKIDLASNEMEGKLVLFDKNPTDVYGFFELLNNRVAFKAGSVEGGNLSMKFSTQMGEMQFKGQVAESELNGKLSMSLLNFDCSGILTGSSEIPGTHLPRIEVIRPLTPGEQTRILGGEAAMWAEVVDANNVESRIWPSSAAIAEKLWSPTELTADTEDMYRRLTVFSDLLERRGSQHLQQMNAILEKLINPEGLPYLTTLVTLLEEAKYYARLTTIMGQQNLYLPDLPLNGVVDAARPESNEARRFNKRVEEYLATPNDTLQSEIIAHLRAWSQLDAQLKPYMNNKALQPVSNISGEFSFVSGVLLQKLASGKIFTEEEKNSLSEKIAFLENGENGMLLAVAPGLRNLLNQ